MGFGKRVRGPAVLGWIAWVLFGVGFSCAETGQDLANRSDQTVSDSPDSSNSTGFPLDLVGSDGYRLHLDQAPRRIIPANATALDFVLALVDGERIAALSEISIPYSIESPVTANWPEAKTFGGFTVEEMVSRDPDLIIVHEWQNAQTVAILRQAGFAVLVIPSLSELQDCFDSLALLGRVLGAEQRAASMIGQMKLRIAELRSRHAEEPPSVLAYTNFGTGGTCAGRDSSFDVMVEIAGLKNAGAEAGVNGFESVDLEWLLAVDPEWIVVGESIEAPGSSATATFLRSTAALKALRAVRENHIVQLTGARFNTTSYQLVDSAADLLAEIDRLSQP